MNKKFIYCTQICSELLQNKGDLELRGQVFSIYETSFNILLETDRLLTVLDASRVINPFSVKTKNRYDFKRLGLQRGQPVIVSEESIDIDSANLYIVLKEAKQWTSNAMLDFTRESLSFVEKQKLSLAGYLVQKGNKLGIYPLVQSLISEIPDLKSLFPFSLPYGEKEKFIEKRFIDFIQAFRQEEKIEIHMKSSKIIGFGIGSTPSMDDFIAGLMVNNIYASYYFERNLKNAFALNEATIDFDLKSTTKISAEMLIHSSKGKVNDALRKVLLAIYSKDEFNNFNSNLNKVIAMGASSGTDTLLGVYCGLCINIQASERI